MYINTGGDMVVTYHQMKHYGGYMGLNSTRDLHLYLILLYTLKKANMYFNEANALACTNSPTDTTLTAFSKLCQSDDFPHLCFTKKYKHLSFPLI